MSRFMHALRQRELSGKVNNDLIHLTTEHILTRLSQYQISTYYLADAINLVSILQFLSLQMTVRDRIFTEISLRFLLDVIYQSWERFHSQDYDFLDNYEALSSSVGDLSTSLWV